MSEFHEPYGPPDEEEEAPSLEAHDPVDLVTTPLRRQYEEIKRRHPGLVLLFQIGDFYEAFDEDAHTLARELGVVLTRKWFGKTDVHPLAGVPLRSLETHLSRLLKRGYKVAICDQVTPPGRGLVEREVTRIITPGTVIEPGMLEGRANNYLAAFIVAEQRVGFAYADISTGEFRATGLDPGQALAELARLSPAELLVPHGMELQELEVRAITRLPDIQTSVEVTRKTLLEHFQVATLDAFGCGGQPLAARAAGAIIAYLRDTQPDALANLTTLQSYGIQSVMQLDQQTLRNLELFTSWSQNGATPVGSLIETIDLTCTSMGGRLLRRWLRHPLLDLLELHVRQGAVDWFFQRDLPREEARALLLEMMDLERTLARVRRRLALPAEVSALARSLRIGGRLRGTLQKHRAPASFVNGLEGSEDLIELIERALAERPGDLERGGVIRAGYSAELDELRAMLSEGRRFLTELETRERARTGIRSLKVAYNKVFGYYLEVTRANLRLVPADYIRKQTLTSAERFFTLELKEHESLIANARERVIELETTLFRQLCEELGRHFERIRRLAATVAHLDAVGALAECAVRYGYVRPELNQGDELVIARGRHPMIERQLPPGAFTANDTCLSSRGTQIALITAPNMAGKSIYLRQVALICLLAQIGSFVPADSARLGLVDRVFTRIGLQEYTQRGQSSFMLEMIETAHILHHATSRSLVLLDEVGRGTSTADGLSIARAVLEYLHNHPRAGARTLFATHYHELTACADTLPRVYNFHLAVLERDGRVEYQHRVEPGRAEKSFGLHVAQLAGLPRPVIHRASELIEAYDQSPETRTLSAEALTGALPLRVASLLDTLGRLDLDEMSPIEALTRLYELQRLAREVESLVLDGDG